MLSYEQYLRESAVSLVDWLDPKPITYRADEQRMIDFEGYLPD